MKQSFNTLSKDASWMVNKAIAKHIQSNDATILLSELIFLHKQHPGKDMVFLNQDRLMQNCNLTLHRLRSSMTLLLEHNLVFREKKKGPSDTTPKNYYKVFEKNIDKILNDYDDRRAGIHSTGEQVTNTVSRNSDDRLAENLSSGDQDSSAHINKIITKKVEPNKEVINDSSNTIEDNSIIDKHNTDLKYILSVKEEVLTPQQKGLKAAQFFQ